MVVGLSQTVDTAMTITVFLSYARADDEKFVARLHADLQNWGFDVWWDRVSMPARGLTFLQEIRDAIDVRDRFLLVLGPQAVRFPSVRSPTGGADGSARSSSE